ncbi:MAG: class IV adenylate cyclase [Spirochaetaceae bacterium]|nr:class IV adenylate cyclase [Spirochaetaceae bacterium]
MAVEIELKARVDDPGGLQTRLCSFAGQGTAFEKWDSYWVFSEADRTDGTALPSGVRLRRETKTSPTGEVFKALWVTYKVKEIREGMEINDEREFSVSDGDMFEELLRRLGLKKDMEKTKTGRTWICDGITTELTDVAGLGWFVELEIIAGDSKDETVTAARKRLLALLRKIGLEEDRIEPRYYTEMLRPPL